MNTQKLSLKSFQIKFASWLAVLVIAFISILTVWQLDWAAADTNCDSPISTPISSSVPCPTPTPSTAPISSSVTPTPSASATPSIAPYAVSITSVSPQAAMPGDTVTLTVTGETGSIDKVYVGDVEIPSFNMLADDTLTFVLPRFTDFKANQTYGVKVRNYFVISYSKNLTILPGVIQVVTPATGSQVMVAPTVNVDKTHPEVVIATTNFDSTINIPADVIGANLNLANVISSSGSSKIAALTQAIKLNSSSKLGSILVDFPAALNISGSTNWSGLLSTPVVASNQAVSIVPDSGKKTEVSAVIELGSSSENLTLDQAVRIALPNQSGKLAGYVRNGQFNKIVTICSADTQVVGNALASGGECYLNVGSSMVIWTKHFTQFVAYTQNDQSSSSSSSNSTSSSSGSSSGSCNDTKPSSAPVLLSAIPAGKNAVTLTWSKASGSVTYYLLAYGLKSGVLQYGNPNVGGANTTMVTVKSLDANTTYYFKIRAFNGCNPSDYSNEIAVKPNGAKVNGAAQGFKAGVLGSAKSKVVVKQAAVQVSPQTGLLASISNFFSKVFHFGK